MSESTTTHNLDVAQGLREVAEFLEAHPELPAVEWAIVQVRYHVGAKSPARETLTALAEALGQRATESARRDEVSIDGRFAGDVRVTASANVSDLAGIPPVPVRVEYEPILKGERS